MNNIDDIIYNDNMKKTYQFFLIIYFLTLIYILFFHFRYHIVISLLLLIPLYFIQHSLYKIEYLTYIYFTQVLGTTCSFYQYPYYDKAMHFISGMIFVIIGYYILKRIIHHRIIYFLINCIEMSVACLWEFYEYSLLIFLNNDALHHYSTGVHDTMQDMLFSFIGGLIITYIIYKYPSYIDNLYIQPQDNLDQSSQQQNI